MVAMPDSVGDQDRRDVEPGDAAAAAWGDPPIVLRCGVERPASLRPDSQCFVVNDVGWLAEEQPDAIVFTTIGQSTYVEVTVPTDYAPEGALLPPISDAVRASTSQPHPCL
jgi:hypothetical protein